MDWILPIVFWISVTPVLYTYCGYPLLIRLLAGAVARRKDESERPSGEVAPTVTVLIAAYNAEQQIEQRIANLLACDYPQERLRILIASDGSTDGTVEQVRRHPDPRVRVIDFRERRGKASALAGAVASVDSDVIVFTDASTHFLADSLRQLARHFGDPSVGIVTGRVGIIDGAGEPIEAFYWRHEIEMRRCEAELGILLGASGAIYAIRRSAFVAPSRPVINDDLVFPMLARLTHGCRFVFDPSARAYVSYIGGLEQEFHRRCRIGAGAYQALTVLHPLLDPRHAKHAFAFASHKLLRWLCPFLLLAAAVSNAALLGHPVYDALFALQVCLYATAVIGLIVRDGGLISRLTRLTTSFCVMNLALLAGFFRWLADSQNATWNPTPRPEGGIVSLSNRLAAPGSAEVSERPAV